MRRALRMIDRLSELMRSQKMDISWNFKMWERHQTPLRNLELWYPTTIVQSGSVRRLLFPDLAMVGSIAWLVCYYNTSVACPAEELIRTLHHGFDVYLHPNMLTLPIAPFGLTSMAIGLLVTFRVETCHKRYAEARELWATCANESKGLASRILERIPAEHNDPAVPRARRHAVRLLRTFPHTLKYRITVDGCNPDIAEGIREKLSEQIHEEKRAGLREELRMIWDMDEPLQRSYVDRLLAAAPHIWPLHVLNELSYLNARIFSSPGLGTLPGPVSADVDKSITVLHTVLGDSERIVVTPIYTEYTKCTSFILCAWCNALPLALFPLVGPAGTMPTSLVVAFFMFSIDDIGSRIEQPFDKLPLWEYCDDIDFSCQQMEQHSEVLRQQAIQSWVDGNRSKWQRSGLMPTGS